MKNYDLITPEGTQDFLFDECIVRRNVENTIHTIFKNSGYCELITPGLEFFDVFSLNSRHFPQESLYKLVDSKGRLLVLRPDSTMPMARVVATRLKDAPLPLRLYYNQCVYNISPMLTGRSDQIVQTGIELIGSSSKTADLEVITTAAEVLSSCDCGKFSLEIGDIGFFRELVNKLDVSEDKKEDIRSLIETKNYPALNDLLDKIGKNDITHALKKLPRLFGKEEVFEKASKLFRDEKIDAILENLKSIYNDVSKLCINGGITVDLGMVNRTDYYTGVIIKGYLEGYGEEVLSGGRYDKLISEFGYDVPATGFAVNVNAVSSVVAKKNKVSVRPADVLVFAEKGYEMKAVLLSQDYRKQGFVTENALSDDFDSAKKYAEKKNIKKIVIVGDDIKEVTE
jgi:ATP phosphoribosyltransferase regulatory subunit